MSGILVLDNTHQCVMGGNVIYVIDKYNFTSGMFLFSGMNSLCLVNRVVKLDSISWKTDNGQPPEQMELLGKVIGMINKEIIKNEAIYTK